MSYILDALKKADAARERGQVPGLHSQRSVGPAELPGSESAGRSPVMALNGLVLVVVLVLLAAAAAWWWQTARPQAEAAATHALPAAPVPVPASAAAPSPGSAPSPAPAPAAMVATAPPTQALPILAPESQPPTAIMAPPAAASAPDAARININTRAPATASASASASARDTTTVTAAVAPNRSDTAVRSLAELAPEIRAQLPQVTVSGSTYSTNPAHRMLIANGQVVREGEEIVPGLKLEGIGPRSAVLNHNGTRYSIGY